MHPENNLAFFIDIFIKTISKASDNFIKHKVSYIKVYEVYLWSLTNKLHLLAAKIMSLTQSQNYVLLCPTLMYDKQWKNKCFIQNLIKLHIYLFLSCEIQVNFYFLIQKTTTHIYIIWYFSNTNIYSFIWLFLKIKRKYIT